MSYRHNDERRVEMARQGFVVRQIHVCRESHQVVSVWYVYDPDDGEREAAAKEASEDESLTEVPGQMP